MNGIIADNEGNVLISVKKVGENGIKERFTPFTHCLAVVRINGDYLMGLNKWRGRYEILGGCIENNETPRECIERECFEELGVLKAEFKFIGVMELLLKPDYFSDKERIEYGGLYGVTLEDRAIEEIYKQVKDKDEIAGLSLYGGIKGKKPVAEIDEKLLEYYNGV